MSGYTPPNNRRKNARIRTESQYPLESQSSYDMEPYIWDPFIFFLRTLSILHPYIESNRCNFHANMGPQYMVYAGSRNPTNMPCKTRAVP